MSNFAALMEKNSMSQVQAKAKRRQARQAFNHLAEKQRPKYTKKDAGKQARRLRELVERQNEMRMRKGGKK